MQSAETVLDVIRSLESRVRGKLASTVREGADGKGPEPRAPRRRPTSLCGSRGVRLPPATRLVTGYQRVMSAADM